MLPVDAFVVLQVHGVVLTCQRTFDTVDYAIFLRRIQNLYGVEQTALQWFGLYLTDRTHQVCINNTLSESQFLKCGVPQGSVIGVRLYSTVNTKTREHGSQSSRKLKMAPVR